MQARNLNPTLLIQTGKQATGSFASGERNEATVSAKVKEPKVSLREATYSQLKDLILNGQLRPSERLSENTLAKRFGVSRTPFARH